MTERIEYIRRLTEEGSKLLPNLLQYDLSEKEMLTLNNYLSQMAVDTLSIDIGEGPIKNEEEASKRMEGAIKQTEEFNNFMKQLLEEKKAGK